MTSKSLCLAMVILLLCHFASAQWVQTDRLNDRQVPHHPLMGTNVSREIPREFLGLPAQHRMQTDVVNRFDSLRAKSMQLQLPDGKFIPNGSQSSVRPLKRTSSPQSQIYVIDTAIVRSTTDTTRHLYSFNAEAKRTSDLTQNLRGGVWIDSWRETYTYDASNNWLSELDEDRSTGQWMNSQRDTYTYDANGRMLSQSDEDWSTGQWVGIWRGTYTYNANGDMLSLLVEDWSTGQWMNYQRYTYTYDANGRMLSQLEEDWSTGQWMNSQRYTCT